MDWLTDALNFDHPVDVEEQALHDIAKREVTAIKTAEKKSRKKKFNIKIRRSIEEFLERKRQRSLEGDLDW